MKSAHGAVGVLLFALVLTGCGIDAGKWRKEMEPLLPEGVSIESIDTHPCGVEPDCIVSLSLLHNPHRYIEEAQAFGNALAGDGWVGRVGSSDSESAGGKFTRDRVTVIFRFTSADWEVECARMWGPENISCFSRISIEE